MSNKTIQLNPVFLSSSTSKAKLASASSAKTLKKEKPVMQNSALIKPNKVKKELLAKIKDFQVKAEEKGITHQESKQQQLDKFDKNFNDEFNKSLTFLQDLSKQQHQQKKEQKEHKNTLKRGRIENEVHMHVATELPIELLAQTQVQMQQAHGQHPYNNGHAKTPPYGILKQGNKPTYRQWHNTTQKLHYPSPAKPLITIEQDVQPTINENERSRNLEMIKQEYKQKQTVAQTVAQPIVPQIVAQQIQPHIPASWGKGAEPPHIPASWGKGAEPPHIPVIPDHAKFASGGKGAEPPYKKRITKTTKYKLGKTKGGNKVSVLIKNNQTRRKVQHEIGLLKQKPILDIKNHLREKNLLKVGSFAPNDVLRQIYEQSILAGDVENKSKDTLIHNFYNDKP